jgi:ribosomal protein S27AE
MGALDDYLRILDDARAETWPRTPTRHLIVKNSHCCPKCSARRIFVVERVVDEARTHHSTPDKFKITLDLFVCGRCGYCETFARDVDEKTKALPAAWVYLIDEVDHPYR